MKNLISTCFLTLAILSMASSTALSDRLAFNTGDSPLHKYAEQKSAGKLHFDFPDGSTKRMEDE